MEGTMKRMTVEELRTNPFEICDLLNALFFGMDVEIVTAIMCVVLDQVCANADYTSEDVIKVYDSMAIAARGAHELMGMPPKMEVSA